MLITKEKRDKFNILEKNQTVATVYIGQIFVGNLNVIFAFINSEKNKRTL